MTTENPQLQRILIVEDEDNARKGYAALLRKWNWAILGVGSGEEALAKFQEFQPDLIRADVGSPALLERALGRSRDQKQVAALTRELRSAGKLGALVGISEEMQEVMRQVEIAAPSTASVLITGETGSGKEMVARSLHMLSPRAERPFI